MSIWRTSTGFAETRGGFMITSIPSEAWNKLSAGQKLIVSLLERKKISPSQVLCDLFNENKNRE